MDELKVLDGESGLLESFPPEMLVRLLSKSSPTDVLALLRKVEETLEELKQWEQEVDMEDVKHFIESGDVRIVMHKDGKPIVFLRDMTNVQSKRKLWKAHWLAVVWIATWGYRLRPVHSEGRHAVIDMFQRSFLDFDRDRVAMHTSILGGLFPMCLPAKIAILAPNKYLRVAMKLAFQILCRSYRDSVCFPASRSAIFTWVEDERQVPEYMTNESNRKYVPTVRSAGPYRELLARRGFSTLTVKDIYRPDADKVRKLLESDLRTPKRRPSTSWYSEASTSEDTVNDTVAGEELG